MLSFSCSSLAGNTFPSPPSTVPRLCLWSFNFSTSFPKTFSGLLRLTQMFFLYTSKVLSTYSVHLENSVVDHWLSEYMLKTYVPEPTSRSVDPEFSFFISACLVFLHNVFYRTCLFSSLLLLGYQQDLCLHNFMHLRRGVGK